MKPSRPSFMPVTPAGSVLGDLERDSEEAAWKALERATADIYPNRAALVKRGYTIAKLEDA